MVTYIHSPGVGKAEHINVGFTIDMSYEDAVKWRNRLTDIIERHEAQPGAERSANGVEHGQTAIPLSTVKRLVRESKLIDKWSGDALIAQLEYAVVAQRQS